MQVQITIVVKPTTRFASFATRNVGNHRTIRTEEGLIHVAAFFAVVFQIVRFILSLTGRGGMTTHQLQSVSGLKLRNPRALSTSSRKENIQLEILLTNSIYFLPSKFQCFTT
jgi:hypothetical protein